MQARGGACVRVPVDARMHACVCNRARLAARMARRPRPPALTIPLTSATANAAPAPASAPPCPAPPWPPVPTPPQCLHPLTPRLTSATANAAPAEVTFASAAACGAAGAAARTAGFSADRSNAAATSGARGDGAGSYSATLLKDTSQARRLVRASAAAAEEPAPGGAQASDAVTWRPNES